MKELSMYPTSAIRKIQPWRRCVRVLATMLAPGTAASAYGATPQYKTFASPEEAAKELIAAAKAGNTKELAAILGADAKGILQSGDAVNDRQGRERFVRSYEEANKLEK